MIRNDPVAEARSAEAPANGSIPEELLRDPLGFLFAEHHRHRQLCRVLQHLADSQVFEGALIAAADDYLRRDLALHVSDEEEDLFPLLRRRCPPEDEIDRIIRRLSADHAEDHSLAQAVRMFFARALEERRAVGAYPGARVVLRRFADQERAHLALENAVVMPIARARLDAADRKGLARRFARRRGIVLEP